MSPSSEGIIGDEGKGGSWARSEVEDLVFSVMQARRLEDRVRSLSQDGALPAAFHTFHVDPRTVAFAHGMTRLANGRGDVCAPGVAAPGPSLAFGATPLEFLRQAGRRGTGPTGGRGGGGDWTDKRHGLFAGIGPPGTLTQVMTGAALAFKQRGEDRVAVAFEEAAAVETGGWHEGINLAGAQRVAVVVVLVHPLDGGAGPDMPEVAVVGTAYGARANRAASDSLHELRNAGRASRIAAAAGEPVIVEVGPLSQVDEKWRLLDELTEWAVEAGHVEPDDLERLSQRAIHDVDHAASRLTNEPPPAPEAALAQVWTDVGPMVPWTRQDPVDPASRQPADPMGEPNVF